MQTEVFENMQKGLAGEIADIGPKDIISRVNTYGSDIPFGVFVTKGAVENSAVLPDATGEITGPSGLGVTVRTLTRTGDAGYADDDVMNVIKRGRVWVPVEDAVEAESQAYVRFADAVGDKQLGAFRSDVDTPDANETQLVSFTGTPTLGTWTLTLGEETTANIAYNANAAAVKAALEALTAITQVTVTGNYSDGFTIEFTGADAKTDFDTLEVDVSELTGVTDAEVTVVQEGSAVDSVALPRVKFVTDADAGEMALLELNMT